MWRLHPSSTARLAYFASTRRFVSTARRNPPPPFQVLEKFSRFRSLFSSFQQTGSHMNHPPRGNGSPYCLSFPQRDLCILADRWTSPSYGFGSPVPPKFSIALHCYPVAVHLRWTLLRSVVQKYSKLINIFPPCVPFAAVERCSWACPALAPPFPPASGVAVYGPLSMCQLIMNDPRFLNHVVLGPSVPDSRNFVAVFRGMGS